MLEILEGLLVDLISVDYFIVIFTGLNIMYCTGLQFTDMDNDAIDLFTMKAL